MTKPQTFNDGIVNIYSVSDVAEQGEMPVEKLTLKQTLRYHERTVGLTRFYTALQANANVKYVLRCPRLRDISTQDIAMPNDDNQYRVSLIQYPEDIEPSVMDITLEELVAVYDIYQPELEEPPEEGELDEP